jgi:hypothetical protein
LNLSNQFLTIQKSNIQIVMVIFKHLLSIYRIATLQSIN